MEIYFPFCTAPTILAIIITNLKTAPERKIPSLKALPQLNITLIVQQTSNSTYTYVCIRIKP